MALLDDFLALATTNFSAIALEIPMALIGYTALSVLKTIVFLTPLAIEALNKFSVPKIFVRTASRG